MKKKKLNPETQSSPLTPTTMIPNTNLNIYTYRFIYIQLHTLIIIIPISQADTKTIGFNFTDLYQRSKLQKTQMISSKIKDRISETVTMVAGCRSSSWSASLVITPHLPCRILSEASSDCRPYFLFRYQTTTIALQYPAQHHRTASFPSKEAEDDRERRRWGMGSMVVVWFLIFFFFFNVFGRVNAV